MTRLRLIAPQWQERGLCRQVDPDLFYPDRWSSAEPAKAICRRCEVKDECRAYALTTNERHGVWGGLSERDREHMRKNRKQGVAA